MWIYLATLFWKANKRKAASSATFLAGLIIMALWGVYFITV